jgi:hypothetical protein
MCDVVINASGCFSSRTSLLSSACSLHELRPQHLARAINSTHEVVPRLYPMGGARKSSSKITEHINTELFLEEGTGHHRYSFFFHHLDGTKKGVFCFR